LKWIGQHIVDLISRFRSDVYLDSPTAGGSDPDKFLGIDSNNKVIYRTGSQVASDIGASADTDTTYSISCEDGDETSQEKIRLTAGGSGSGTDDIVLEAGEGLSISRSSDTITFTNSNPEDTNTNQLTTFTLTGDSGSNQSIAHGNTLDIAGGNAISTVVGATDTVTINHDDTSSQTSVDNSGSTYIQDVTLDTYGHVTGLTSAAIPTLNQSTTGSAATLTTTRAFQTDLASTSSANFDGSAANTHGVTGTLAVGNGGTGLTSISTLLNSNVTSVSGNAGGLTASTSNSIGVGSIELGHADDTTIARSASGVATIESNIIQTRNKVIHIEHSNFSDDIDTTEHFIPFVTTAEHTSFANVVTPMIMPVAGKLLKVHYKANNHTHTSSNEVTFRLYDLDDGELWSDGNKTVIGTKVVDGVNRVNMCTADFQDLTTSGASGTNAFTAGEMIGVSLQNSQDLSTTTKYSVTMVFELDFNSY
tara:strand:- start:934 stop:2364 length:1431 start_codon:yes stop_codon:yes gene_type:complete